MREYITGRNPVYEVFQARRRHIFKVQLAQGISETEHIRAILAEAARLKIPVERVHRERLDKFGDHHQGIAVEVNEYPYADLEDILALAAKKAEPLLVLLLDMIQNPQNFGTLIRSAEAAGVHGIIIPLRGAAGITPAVVNASSGAAEHMLIASMNLAQAIDALKQSDAWILGLEGAQGSQPLQSTRLDMPIGLVVGNEGEGMRRLVREKCDVLVSLPMRGRVDSLNAAVAGSITLYQILFARMARQKQTGSDE